MALPTIYFGLGVTDHGTERHDSGSTELGSISSYRHNPLWLLAVGEVTRSTIAAVRHV